MTAGRCPEPRTVERCARWAWHLLSQPCPPAVLHAAAIDLARAIERGDPLPKMICGADPTAGPMPVPAKPARARRGTVPS